MVDGWCLRTCARAKARPATTKVQVTRFTVASGSSGQAKAHVGVRRATTVGKGQTLLLGFVAGAMFLLGLLLGRLRGPAPGLGVLCNASVIGVLIFLPWDVPTQAWEPTRPFAGCPAGLATCRLARAPDLPVAWGLRSTVVVSRTSLAPVVPRKHRGFGRGRMVRSGRPGLHCSGRPWRRGRR